jgi:hypothetical protein
LAIVFPASEKTSAVEFLSVASQDGDPAVRTPATRYWFWFLAGGYLAGFYFGWFVSLFVYFI